MHMTSELQPWEQALMLRIVEDLMASCACDDEDPQYNDDDEVNSPDHYQSDSGMEAIDVIEEFNLNFNLGNVVKYVLRAEKKSDSAITDLKKALWYLQREVHAQEENCRGRD